jgi:hypothetical protein
LGFLAGLGLVSDHVSAVGYMITGASLVARQVMGAENFALAFTEICDLVTLRAASASIFPAALNFKNYDSGAICHGISAASVSRIKLLFKGER